MSAHRCAKPVQQKAKFCLCTFMGCFYLHCPFGDPPQAPGSLSWVHVVCHTMCSSCSLHSWQLSVSFIPLRLFFLRFARLRFIHWLYDSFRCMVFTLTHKPTRKNTHTALVMTKGSFRCIFTPLRHHALQYDSVHRCP